MGKEITFTMVTHVSIPTIVY